MVDFKKLLGITPEDRAAALERAQSAMLREIQEQVSSRAQMVERLGRNGHLLNEKARQFVSTLARKAKRTSIGGLLGGELSDLSAAQVSYLEDLHDLVVRHQEPGSSVDRSQDEGSRANRYGSRPA